MRIVVDLDGVLCTLKKDGETYSDVKPLDSAIEKMKILKEKGHYIIIHTARHMKTTQSNLGRINRKIGFQTLAWLEKYDIPYDEIYFGKPYGQVYIDDSAYIFKSWDDIEVGDFNEKCLNIVIPMAGEGSRFKNSGYELPKPLIKLKGKEMFRWAADSFKSLQIPNNLIFIVLKQHIDDYKIDQIITKYYPKARIIILHEITRGQAETVLKAKKYIDNFNKLLIFNADTFFNSEKLTEVIQKTKVDGAVACFYDKSTTDKYSFVKVDEHNNILSVAEKQRISDYASNGLYYFKHGKDFVETVKEMISNNETTREEFFVIPVYNKLLERGYRIKMFLVEQNWIIGTPDELAYLKEYYNE